MLTLKEAFTEAENRRPYQDNAELIQQITPEGGEWTAIIDQTNCPRKVWWRGGIVAVVDPIGEFPAQADAVLMAMRAMPTMDAALRAIITLSESPDNLLRIRKLAEAVVAYVEEPAPSNRNA